MASSSALLGCSLCALLCVCSMQTGVLATDAPASLNLTYYLTEIRGLPGTNGTLFPAAGTGQLNFSAAEWGTFFVFDNPLRDAPTADATLLGRSTGTAVVTTRGGIPEGGIQMTAQHIFDIASAYYKSSLTLIGTVDFLHAPPSECVVAGGTGIFRGYRGYGLVELETSPFAPLVVYKWSLFLSK